MTEILSPRGLAIVSPGKDAIYARKLSVAEPEHLVQTAAIIREGGIVAFPFNGVFGLFGDIDNAATAEAIIEAKDRPKDRKLIAVCTPETIDQLADLSRIRIPTERLIALWRDIHALGMILPASSQSPSHLVVGEGTDSTILNIWTEYLPLRTMMGHYYSLGGRGLVGTSANKGGEATHFDPDSLYIEFRSNVEAVIYDHFDHLPIQRRRSTTIIDLTNHRPRLHREGNVSETELREALRRHNFPELWVGRDVISTRGRASE